MQRFQESQALVAEKAELEQKLSDRKLIERAKGKLMKTGLEEEQAYRALQLYARNNRLTLAKAAEFV